VTVSTLPLVETFLLSSSGLLSWLLEQPVQKKWNPSELKQYVFPEYRQFHFAIPDTVFNGRWDVLENNSKQNRSVVYSALTGLGDLFFSFDDGIPFVKLNAFGHWQNLLTRLSGLPIMVAAHVQEKSYRYHDTDNNAILSRQRWDFWDRCLGSSSLARPWAGVVEDYIEKEGLHESHLHLNGSTHAELCWQRALIDPIGEVNEFSSILSTNSSRGSSIKELVKSIDPNFNLYKFQKHLRLARNIRIFLTNWTTGRSSKPELIKSYNFLSSEKWSYYENSDFHSTYWPTDLKSVNQAHRAHIKEAVWLESLFLKLQKEPRTVIDKLLLVYLLIQNQYLQILVQRDDLYGFDEFQKYTFTDLREFAEKEYLNRFKHANGKNNNLSTCLFYEARFAPKDEYDKNLNLLKRILKGYDQYLNEKERSDPNEGLRDILENIENFKPNQNSRKIQLSLVAHFIKKPWDYRKQQSYRHSELRLSLKEQADKLCSLLRDEPLLKKWIRGIDAASNELYASPEVFAPIFRVCCRAGIDNHTYHVGEDFIHLVGGIRQISDALNMLDMSRGDRLGHATAVGIHPKAWLNSMPGEIMVTRGEWMLDLLYAWYYLSQRADCLEWAMKAQTETCKLATLIFNQPFSIELLKSVMDLRHLWPEYVQEAVNNKNWNPTFLLDDNWRQEGRLVKKLAGSQALIFLNKWLTDGNHWKRSEEKISVKANFFPEPILIALQQQVMQEIVKKGVIVETLPTSNVRISQYTHIHEHHVFRWMHLPGVKVDGDPDIQVCLGSDDPGIFATDLHNEFYHLYAVLVNEFGTTDKEAISMLGKVNERGRHYRFHPR